MKILGVLFRRNTNKHKKNKKCSSNNIKKLLKKQIVNQSNKKLRKTNYLSTRCLLQEKSSNLAQHQKVIVPKSFKMKIQTITN